MKVKISDRFQTHATNIVHQTLPIRFTDLHTLLGSFKVKKVIKQSALICQSHPIRHLIHPTLFHKVMPQMFHGDAAKDLRHRFDHHEGTVGLGWHHPGCKILESEPHGFAFDVFEKDGVIGVRVSGTVEGLVEDAFKQVPR
jgi:hypothetical protein